MENRSKILQCYPDQPTFTAEGYVVRGLYVYQIQHWYQQWLLAFCSYVERLKFYPPEQFFIAKFEDVVKDPVRFMWDVSTFLQIRPFDWRKLVEKYDQPVNKGTLRVKWFLAYFAQGQVEEPDRNASFVEELKQFYLPHNKRLTKLLNHDYDWQWQFCLQAEEFTYKVDPSYLLACDLLQCFIIVAVLFRGNRGRSQSQDLTGKTCSYSLDRARNVRYDVKTPQSGNIIAKRMDISQVQYLQIRSIAIAHAANSWNCGNDLTLFFTRQHWYCTLVEKLLSGPLDRKQICQILVRSPIILFQLRSYSLWERT